MRTSQPPPRHASQRQSFQQRNVEILRKTGKESSNGFIAMESVAPLHQPLSQECHEAVTADLKLGINFSRVLANLPLKKTVQLLNGEVSYQHKGGPSSCTMDQWYAVARQMLASIQIEFPGQGAAFEAYISKIMTCGRQYGAERAQTFDRMHRARAEATARMTDRLPDWEPGVDFHLAAFSGCQTTLCWCGSHGHTPEMHDQAAHAPGPGTRRPTTDATAAAPRANAAVQDVCSFFNKDRGCKKTAAACTFKHVCNKCGGDHPRHQCPKATAGGRKQGCGASTVGAVTSTTRRAPMPPLPPESVPSLPPERPPAAPSPDGPDPAPHHPASQAWLVQCATTFRQDPDPWRQRFADALEGALGDGHTSGCEVTADVAIGADVPRREANTTLPFYDEQGLPTFGCAFELPTPPNRAWTAAPLTGIEGVCVINVVELRRALRGHQNRKFVAWLLQGCVDGFDLLIEAEENGPVVHPNKVLELPAHREHLHKEFAAERAAGRHAKVDPNCHPHLQVQSQGVVSKKSYEEGVLKWRTVINLSACSASQDSINSGIQDLALAFMKHHEIMAEMVRRGPQSTACVADLRHACRQLKVRPSLFHLLGLQLGGVTVVDTSPGFGSRSAPWIFQNFMHAIAWISADGHRPCLRPWNREMVHLPGRRRGSM